MKAFLLGLQALVERLPHWMILVLAAGVGAVFSYFQAEPNAQILSAFTSLAVALPMLKGALVAFAGTVIALLKTAPWSTPQPTSVRRVPPLAVMAFLPIALLLAGCFGAGSIAPTANFAVCVATDAIEKKPIATIVADCGGDVPAVIASLLTSTDARVAETPALAEAKRTRTTLALVGADAGSP